MPERIENKPVLAVALNRDAGDVAVRRAQAADVDVVVLAERGYRPPVDASEVISVPMNQARVGNAIHEAIDRDLAWVLVPRHMGTADYLLSAALRSVGKYVDTDHPGIAMLVVSPHTDPTRAYRRALTVVDPAGPRTSGVSALAAVALAARTGAHLDVMVLGRPDDSGRLPASEWLAMLPTERRTDLIRRALNRAKDSGVEITWVPTALTDPVAALRQQLTRADYDVVIDSLGGHRLRKRIRKSHDIRRLLDEPAHGGVLRTMLGHDEFDVLVVIDGISLGMVPAPAVKAGAAAAIALGTVAMATPAAATAPTASVNVVTAAGKSAKVSAAQVARAEKKASKAEAAADEARSSAQRAKAKAKEARAEADEAAEALAEARADAEPAAEELKEARLEMRDAKDELREAEVRRDAAERRAQGLSPMTDTPLAQEQAQKALEDEVRARAEATRSESAAAVAYREYQEFEQQVLAAEEAFTEADDEAKKARARFREQAEQAEAAKAKASRLDEAAAEVRAAWAEQGLYRPATGRVTSAFGPRVHPVTGVYKQHTGTDFAGTDGNYYAMADGVVTYAGYDGAYGYMVKVDHGKVAGHKTESWYAHQPGLNVSVGQSVSRGEVIGRIGNTGYSTGPHAHVELHLNGQPVDVMAHLP